MNHRAYCLIAAAGMLCCGCAADSVPSQDTAETTAMTVSTEATAETEAPNTAAATELFQGGIGDERSADIPLPEHFVYRFHEDSVSVRLAGGTYQVLSYDFSAIFEQERDAVAFYLDDFNTDGAYDLFAPIRYDDDEILTYAVFLWDSEQERFTEEPFIYEPAKGEYT